MYTERNKVGKKDIDELQTICRNIHLSKLYNF